MRGRFFFWVWWCWSFRTVLSWTVLRLRSRQLRLGVTARFVASFFPSSFLLLIARISLCSLTFFVATFPTLRLFPCVWLRLAGRCAGFGGQYAQNCISLVFSCKLLGFCTVSLFIFAYIAVRKSGGQWRFWIRCTFYPAKLFSLLRTGTFLDSLRGD